LRDEHHLDVVWRAFPLHPETPPEGKSLQQLFAGRNLDIPAMLARLAKAAAEENLPWGERSMTFNSRRAQELGKWAEEQGAGEAFHQAAFRAYFVQGLNLYDHQTLRGLAEEVGLDADQGLDLLKQGKLAGAVDADWSQARAWGVTAVPTFVAGGKALVGAYPYQDLARFAQQAGIQPK